MPSRADTRLDFVASGDVRIAVERDGPAEGVNVVFLHGGAQSRSAWRSGARIFSAAGYRVTLMDLRGHGDSDWAPDGDYSIDRHVEDLVAVIRAAGAPAILLGASLGGHIATQVAARFPELVRALLLADVTPWIDEAAADDMRDTMRGAADGFATIEEAAAMVDRVRGSAPRGVAEGLRPFLRTGRDGRLYWRWDARFVEDRFVRHGGEGGLYAQAAARLSVPVLLMRGALSDVTTPWQVARFRQALPSLRSVTIPDVGHMLTGDSNHAYAAAALTHVQAG